MSGNTETYNIAYDNEMDAVLMKWNGYATSPQFREGTELMLNTLIQHRASKVIADIKEMTLIGMEDQQWLDTYFLPRAIDHGFKAIAIIKPDSYFNKVAVESISFKVAGDKLKIQLFNNLEDAREWLGNI